MSAKGPQLRPGDTVPGTKYQVVRSLGAGGMGVVYQVVKQPNIGGVLKLMSTELTSHEEHRMRFFDEVRILAQLDHPNIVKVFDYDALPDGTPFYVMELLSGRTVRDVIYTMGRVPPRVAYEVTRQLLEALQCAHTHEVQVVHRDIKPENIFLHAPRHGEPVVKLIDFGVSAVADRKHDGTFVGTWSYAAPEQIRGEVPTAATDLYACGLVLYEMLAGVGPFDHYDDWAKVSKAQLEEIPAPVSKFAPWVPASIVTLIASALAKDPRMRPRDAYAFAEQLFELEWATDGKNPHDLTMAGPLQISGDLAGRAPPGTAPSPAAAARPRARSDGAIQIAGNGPLALALSTVTGAKASSKKLAAASLAPDRLGDVPLIGVPPESVRSGPTWRGIGEARQEPTSPDANALLAGLGATPQRPGSKRERERESDPDIAVPRSSTPRAGQVVIRAGTNATDPHEEHGPTTPRALPIQPNERLSHEAAAEGADAATGGAGHYPAPTRDTFSSQHTDPRSAPRRTRAGLFALAGILLFTGAVIAGVVVVRGEKASVSTGAEPRSNPVAPAMTAATTAPSPGAISSAPTSIVAAETASAPPSTPQSAPAAPSQKSVTTKTPGRRSGASAPSAPSSARPTSTPAAPITNGSPPSPAPKPGNTGDFIRTF